MIIRRTPGALRAKCANQSPFPQTTALPSCCVAAARARCPSFAALRGARRRPKASGHEVVPGFIGVRVDQYSVRPQNTAAIFSQCTRKYQICLVVFPNSHPMQRPFEPPGKPIQPCFGSQESVAFRHCCGFWVHERAGVQRIASGANGRTH